MAWVKPFDSGIVTLGATPASVAVALQIPKNQQKVYRLDLQPDAANANPCYYGGASVATTGIRMEAPESGIPPAPAIWENYLAGTGIDLSEVYLSGTEGEKVRVCAVAYM